MFELGSLPLGNISGVADHTKDESRQDVRLSGEISREA